MAGNDLTVAADSPFVGARLDKSLTALASIGTRSRVRKAIESGKVTINGRPCTLKDANRALKVGDALQVEWNKPGTAKQHVQGRKQAAEAGLRILYQDNDVIVIDKPPGILTDSATRAQQRDETTVRDLVNAILKPQGKKAFVVHRIDRDTSGAVALAKNEAAAEILHQSFLDHRPVRKYWTLVAGGPEDDAGTWQHLMRWNGHSLRQVPGRPNDADAVVAESHYKVIERIDEHRPPATVMEIFLVNGRRNQIRLQCQLEGHPIAGEKLYIDDDSLFQISAPRQALHAIYLEFQHPITKALVKVNCPLAPDLGHLLGQVRNRAQKGQKRSRRRRGDGEASRVSVGSGAPALTEDEE